MALYFAPNRNGNLKIGVSVSKKIGKSTVRNRIKRVFKEAARSLIPRIDRRYNYILVARMNAEDYSFDQIVHTLESLLKKVGCIDNEISDSSAN